MRSLPRIIGDVWRNFWIWLGNRTRSIGRRPPYYVHLRIDGSLSEQAAPQPRWQRFVSFTGLRFRDPGVTLSGLRKLFERLSEDPRALGVLLQLDGLQANWAKAQSLRGIMQRLQADGKTVIVYSNAFDNVRYFIACAADQIIAMPTTGWNVIGIRVDSFYLKDALKAVDLSGEVVAVSPYKTAGDVLTRTDMSPEERENIEGLLEAYYDELVSAVAKGRSLDLDEVRQQIDRAPMTVEQALKGALLDHVLYLDQIERQVLQSGHSDSKPRLLSLAAVVRRLKRPVRWRSGQAIGVVSLEGTIVSGSSRRMPIPLPVPFITSDQAGADSVSAALRAAEKDRSIAGVVLYVNSPGGSSLASEAIWREAARLARKKPLVVYMDGVAASGGYYVSTHAHWIVCQPLTQTGSIGVIWIKLVVSQLMERLRIGRGSVQRGAHAGIFSDVDRLGPDERSLIEGYVASLYEAFQDRVADGRKLSTEELERVSGGRVWAGRQAIGLKLVDELGDFECAVQKARELAGLPEDRWSPTVWMTPASLHLLPEPTSKAVEELARWLEPYRTVQAWYLSPTRFKIR